MAVNTYGCWVVEPHHGLPPGTEQYDTFTEAIHWAQAAGWDVVDKKGNKTAQRPDIPNVEYHLHRVGARYHWRRSKVEMP